MTLIQKCQVDWAMVLLIEWQGFTFPFQEHVQLYIDKDGNRALVAAVNLLFLSKCYNQTYMITSFQMDLFPKEKFWKIFYISTLWPEFLSQLKYIYVQCQLMNVNQNPRVSKYHHEVAVVWPDVQFCPYSYKQTQYLLTKIALIFNFRNMQVITFVLV